MIKFNFTDTATLSASVSGSGQLIKDGIGVLTLTGNNTYTGATTVNAGVLLAGSAGAFSPASAFTVNTGAVLDLGGFDNAVGSLSGSGVVQNSATSEVPTSPTNAAVTAALPANTLTVGGNNTSTTFSGTLQDGTNVLALNKVGTGTLVLTGTNTYTGSDHDQRRNAPARRWRHDRKHRRGCHRQRDFGLRSERRSHLCRSDQWHGQRSTEWDRNTCCSG